MNPSLKLLQLARCIGAAVLLVPIVAHAQQVIPVSSVGALQAAINSVPNGGIIDLAPGSYSAPSGGFTMFDPSKGFTVRAQGGQQVTLTGGGSTDIVRIGNHTAGTGRVITFSGITFENGVSGTDFIGGALTLASTEAEFLDCTFRNNKANPGTTGGGAQWIDSSVVSFQRCTWTGNQSKNYGAGFSALKSSVFIAGSRFTSNLANVPGHKSNANGGALVARASTVRISGTAFDDNHAGYVGGAIYTFGDWGTPESVPAVDLVVSNCSFTNNSAARDASVASGNPALGGAVHLEDQTTGRFINCRFIGNSARQGGAISNYRAISTIEGCIFKGNQATGTGSAEGIGGTIIALSFDGLDASTNGGRINRRSALLNVSDSYFEGSGSDGRQGGGIFASGDLNAAYGFGGVPRDTSQPPENNRAVVNLKRVAFVGFSALSASGNGTPGTGGAFMGDFVDLTMEDSMVQNCNASDYGGGVHIVQGSRAAISRSTLSQCRSAGSLGGAMTMFGGELNISDSNFLQNSVSTDGRGAALTTVGDTSSGARPPVDMTGLVQNCVFSQNTGGPTIYDGDSTTGAPPYNRLEYSSNSFFTTDFPYTSDLGGERDVALLNLLTFPRLVGALTVKAPQPNTAMTAPPTLGVLMMVPAALSQSGAAGEATPIASYLPFAWSGNTASLDRDHLDASFGSPATTSEGPHKLSLGGKDYSTVPPGAGAVNIATRSPVGTDSSILIGGFIIQGSEPKRVLIRAVGPSLSSRGINGALADPLLELFDASGNQIAANNDWRTTQVGGMIAANQVLEIASTGAAPTSGAEPALVARLAPGAYTAKVRGANNSTGIAVVEIYDLDAGATTKLANISTRGVVNTGENVLIGGFIYSGGAGATKVAIRAIGPSLAAAGVAQPLLDPAVDVYNENGVRVDGNDNWKSNTRELQAVGLQPTDDREAALILVTPSRGSYTAVVSGSNGETGVGLIEVYVFE